MRILLCFIFLTCFSSCEKETESPKFKATDIVEIGGTFLNDDGSPVADTNIHLQNLRRYGYIDILSSTILSDYIKFMINLAFWPFQIYSNPVQEKKEKADYFIDEIKTNSQGEFLFNGGI